MIKNKAVTSSQDTAYASKYTYEVESMKVNQEIDPNKNKEVTNYNLHKEQMPSNLEYVDSFRDAGTGTSGTAFKDKKTGEVIVAYTGTNLEVDKQDVMTDGVSIGLGAGYHYDSAYRFYDKMAAKYGSANIILTGHSLGGNVAQRVALKKNAQNTIVYNAAPLYVPVAPGLLAGLNPALALVAGLASVGNIKAIMTDQKTFTGKVTRIRTEEDPLNNAANTAAGVYIGDDYVIKNSGGHSLDDILNDSKQMKQIEAIVMKAEKDSALKVQKTIHTVDDQMKSIQKMKSKYSSDGLSDSEKIFLDAEQADAVIKGLTTISNEAVTQAEVEKTKANEKATKIYAKLDDVPFGMVLTPDEVKAAYAEAGCTYDSIVGDVERHCSKTQQKFQGLADDFSDLQGRIGQAIETMVQTDNEIAGMINAG